jgi:hypothetical protein
MGRKEHESREQHSPEEDVSVGPTIVGGQPPPHRHRSTVDVPVGLERLLYAAAVDAEFREVLLRERETAARARGFSLRDSESAMLRTVPEAQLRAAIDSVDTTTENLERRTFLRAVAASAVTLAAGGALGGCGEEKVQVHMNDAGGIRPDGDAGPRRDTVTTDTAEPSRGIRPDVVPVDLPKPGVDGIRPGG